jgi:hypothetical protein
MCCYCFTPGCNTLPDDAVIIPPTTHAGAIETPQDWAHRTKPLHPEHHLMAVQWDDEHVRDDFVAVDEEVDGAADILARVRRCS